MLCSSSTSLLLSLLVKGDLDAFYFEFLSVVKLSHIPREINTELEKQMRAKGLTVTGQTLVQKWVDYGKPRNLDDLEEYVDRVKTTDNFVEALKSSGSGEDNSFSAYRGSL